MAGGDREPVELFELKRPTQASAFSRNSLSVEPVTSAASSDAHSLEDTLVVDHSAAPCLGHPTFPFVVQHVQFRQGSLLGPGP